MPPAMLLLYTTLLYSIVPAAAAQSSSDEWSGPSVRPIHHQTEPGGGGFLALEIGQQQLPHTTTLSPPFWLTLTLSLPNTAAGEPDDTSMFDEQIRRAAAAGLRLVCICLTPDNYPQGTRPGASPWFSDTSPLDSRTRRLLDRVLVLHPTALFIIRFYAQQPDMLMDTVLLNLTDDGRVDLYNVTDPRFRGPGMMNSLTLEWERSAAAKLRLMLRYLDRVYPRRIAGVFPTFLHTAEWFMPGFGYDFAPGELLVSDYSEGMRQRYCADVDTRPNCSLPLPSWRNRAVFGDGFAAREVVALNLFYSGVVASAIEALVEAAKQACDGKCMTLAYYGYHFELAGSRLPGSGHLALTRLLSSPHLDAVVSPYTYQAFVRNNSRGAPMTAHGPWDSAAAHGKFWVIEDDSRTVLDPLPGNIKYSYTNADTAQLLRRNMLTALMHSSALYFYDLNHAGYFGNPQYPDATSAIWDSVATVVNVFKRLVQSNQSHALANSHQVVRRLHPQIAVFSDESSAATRTFARLEDLPTTSSPSYGAFDTLLLGSSTAVLGSTGAAVRGFQMTDLLVDRIPPIDWSQFKLCVFLNAFVLTPAVQSAIRSKLQGTHSNCTVVFQYAAGLFNDTSAEANTSRVSDIVQMPLARGPGGIDIEITIASGLQPPLDAMAGLRYGHRGCCGQWQSSVNPWFHLDKSKTTADTVEVLGTLEHAPNAELNAGLLRSRNKATGHITIFSAAPGLPVRLWRGLAQASGVHLFTEQLPIGCVASNAELWIQPLADSVEVTTGGMLLYHAASACLQTADGLMARHVALPFAARVLNESNMTVCEDCTSFVTPPMAAGEVRLYSVQEATNGNRKPAAPPSTQIWEPSFPPMAPPFAPDWRLNASTIILTGNISGWTDTASAAKYGIIGFDWNNAKSIWLKANLNESTCEAALLEQARRVKGAKTGTRVLVYRQALWAISWMESVRAVMYDPAFAGFFIRYKTGEVWKETPEQCDIGHPHHPAGECMLWNWSNTSAQQYFIDVVVGGPRGTGSNAIDGIFLDDPGPGTLAQPMQEYMTGVRRGADAVGMSNGEIEDLSQSTFRMIQNLRIKLASDGKMAWLNGQWTSGPFLPISGNWKADGNWEADENCSTFSISLTCGWWKTPQPGRACEEFYRSRCNQPSYAALDLGVLTPTNESSCHSMGCYQLAIASLLLLRQERAWFVTAAWQQTSNSSIPLIWTRDLDRNVGMPLGACVESEPGVFSRKWSGGTVSIDCSNLSVALPGKVPVNYER